MSLNIELYEVQAHEIKVTPHLTLVAHTYAHNFLIYYGDISWCATNQNLEQKSMCKTLLEFLFTSTSKNHLLNPNFICVH
jgi:hypothetical protein